MPEYYNYQMVVLATEKVTSLPKTEEELANLAKKQLFALPEYRLVGVKILRSYAVLIVDTDRGIALSEGVLKNVWRRRVAEMFPRMGFKAIKILIKLQGGQLKNAD